MARKKVNVYESENDIFPVKLRMLMSETGTSQEALANYVGVTRQSIGYYTQGQSSPDWRGLVKIAEFFNVSLDYLFGRTDDPQGSAAKKPNALQIDSPEIAAFVEMCFDPNSPVNGKLKEALVKMLQEETK